MRTFVLVLLTTLTLILAPMTAAHAFTPLPANAPPSPNTQTTLSTVHSITEARRCIALSYISGAYALNLTEEDWTYADAPYVVGEWNDALWHEFNVQADEGIQDSEIWLVTSTNDCMVAAYGNSDGV